MQLLPAGGRNRAVGGVEQQARAEDELPWCSAGPQQAFLGCLPQDALRERDVVGQRRLQEPDRKGLSDYSRGLHHASHGDTDGIQLRQEELLEGGRQT